MYEIPRIGELRTTPPTKEEIEQARKQREEFLAAEAKMIEKNKDLYDEVAALLK